MDSNDWTTCSIPARGQVHDSELYLQPGVSLCGIRSSQFAHHDKAVARLNHGSFGCTPASVHSAQAKWKEHALRQPDPFINHELILRLRESRVAVAEMIGASSVDGVFLLDNVTTAIAMVAQNLVWDFLEGRFNKGDVVLMLNFAYGGVKKCLESLIGRAGGRVVSLKIPFPVSSREKFLQTFHESLAKVKKENPSAVFRLAVIDHVTSMPAILLPVREMVDIARSFAVEKVFVDGAHAFGNAPVNVEEIGADYYSSNLHKWMFTPSSAAFFHCKPERLSGLHHPIVSTTHGQGLAAECAWVGTRDFSSMLAVPAAVNFVRELGGVELVRAFNHKSAVAMGTMLAEAWGTGIGAPLEMFSSMVMVGLPPVLDIQSFEEGLELRTTLREDFSVEVPFHYVSREDQELADEVVHVRGVTAYARVSHQIYNSLDDYHRLRDAIVCLVDRKRIQTDRTLKFECKSI